MCTVGTQASDKVAEEERQRKAAEEKRQREAAAKAAAQVSFRIPDKQVFPHDHLDQVEIHNSTMLRNTTSTA